MKSFSRKFVGVLNAPFIFVGFFPFSQVTRLFSSTKWRQRIFFWLPPPPSAIQCNKEVKDSVCWLAKGKQGPFASIKSVLNSQKSWRKETGVAMSLPQEGKLLSTAVEEWQIWGSDQIVGLPPRQSSYFKVLSVINTTENQFFSLRLIPGSLAIATVWKLQNKVFETMTMRFIPQTHPAQNKRQFLNARDLSVCWS